MNPYNEKALETYLQTGAVPSHLVKMLVEERARLKEACDAFEKNSENAAQLFEALLKAREYIKNAPCQCDQSVGVTCPACDLRSTIDAALAKREFPRCAVCRRPFDHGCNSEFCSPQCEALASAAVFLRNNTPIYPGSVISVALLTATPIPEPCCPQCESAPVPATREGPHGVIAYCCSKCGGEWAVGSLGVLLWSRKGGAKP